MRHLSRWLTLGVLGVVALPACSDPLSLEDVLGVWNATSINGYPVPGTVVYQGSSYEAQYVQWALLGERQCTLTQQVDGATETLGQCDYTVDLREKTVTINFRSETWEGRIDGNRMTLTDPQDIVWMLQKE